MTCSLMFTLDYELFGDGSGNVIREQINPTSSLLNIFDQYNAKLTIFFEFGQYKSMKLAGMVKDCKLIDDQLIDAIKRGHDVQLHYHPTWYNAKYINGAFLLNESLFDISFMEPSIIRSELSWGKQFLESLLKPYRRDYKCIAFRSGALSMKNSAKVINVLFELGFKIDSSVAPKAHFKSSYGQYDYRKAPYLTAEWPIRESLIIPEIDNYLWELPIISLKNRLGFLKYFNSRSLFSRRISSYYYRNKISEKNLTNYQKLKKLLGRDYFIGDFNMMSIKTLIKICKLCLQKSNHTDLFPIVLIGHSKSSYNNDDLILFFEKLKELNIVMNTISGYANNKNLIQ